LYSPVFNRFAGIVKLNGLGTAWLKRLRAMSTRRLDLSPGISEKYFASSGWWLVAQGPSVPRHCTVRGCQSVVRRHHLMGTMLDRIATFGQRLNVFGTGLARLRAETAGFLCCQALTIIGV
jgi:hypothetical protein